MEEHQRGQATSGCDGDACGVVSYEIEVPTPANLDGVDVVFRAEFEYRTEGGVSPRPGASFSVGRVPPLEAIPGENPQLPAAEEFTPATAEWLASGLEARGVTYLFEMSFGAHGGGDIVTRDMRLVADMRPAEPLRFQRSFPASWAVDCPAECRRAFSIDVGTTSARQFDVQLRADFSYRTETGAPGFVAEGVVRGGSDSWQMDGGRIPLEPAPEGLLPKPLRWSLQNVAASAEGTTVELVLTAEEGSPAAASGRLYGQHFDLQVVVRLIPS